MASTPQSAASAAPPRTRAPRSFPEDCKEVLQGLRGALLDALTQVGVDPAKPQEVARQLGLHRNLTWKVSKIVTGTNVFAAVPHVPGKSGMDILNAALLKAGAPAAAVTRIQEAMTRFEQMVTDHAGDRATLELVAGGFVPEANQRETMLQARRQAFRGNSATWSVQARVNLVLNILAPSPDDPTRVDLAQVHGLVDFRRLRPDVAWPLFSLQTWDDAGTERPVAGLSIDPLDDPPGVPWLTDFCSDELPEVNVLEMENRIEYELAPGPVGRTGEITCIYGSLLSSLGSQYAERGDETCELACNLTTPAELMHFDLLVHESLEWAKSPRPEVFSKLEGRPVFGAQRKACNLVESECQVHELGRGIATMGTPHIQRYSELLEHVFERLGWDESAFHGFRFQLNYPPIPALGMMSMDLLPAGSRNGT